MHLLQYNTHLFLDTLLNLGPEYQDEIRLEHIITRINASGADIIGLNEIWADSVKDTIIKRTARSYQYSFYQPNTDNFKLGSGLLLLSKHLITKPKFTGYTDLVGSDALSHKGFISASILVKRDGNFFPHWVVITHTQSGASPADIAARRVGFDQMWSAIRGLPFGTNPLFVFGDLNVIGESGGRPTAEYISLTQKLGSLGLKDLFRVVHPDAFAVPGYTFDWFTNALARIFTPNEKVKERLDYVFARNLPGDMKAVIIDVILDYKYNDPKTPYQMDLSDHYPLNLKI